MQDAIIIGILIVVGFLAIRSSVKHFKRQGGCCGGSSVPKQKKKVIKNVHTRKTLVLSGLHCENCKKSVERAINAIDGASAKVNLKEQTAEVLLERDVKDEILKAAVVKAGFQVIRIQAN